MKFKANINRISSVSKKTHYLREGYTAAVDLFKEKVKYDFDMHVTIIISTANVYYHSAANVKLGLLFRDKV